ncbi:hypothetical protein T492DRAFT_1065375 [Pavlovales sp. CCMP2436]|nr:hypothetical protein T492DRAFT_1065375 [Pavlovales sp. CCMP2436]|mmetsp:Transcript_44157/g.109321  ORF Transcript_44157/g.109321 Transcript_44157/m.109321 type:complete len:126 (-) Transcript_44157:181-558(-)
MGAGMLGSAAGVLDLLVSTPVRDVTQLFATVMFWVLLAAFVAYILAISVHSLRHGVAPSPAAHVLEAGQRNRAELAFHDAVAAPTIRPPATEYLRKVKQGSLGSTPYSSSAPSPAPKARPTPNSP